MISRAITFRKRVAIDFSGIGGYRASIETNQEIFAQLDAKDNDFKLSDLSSLESKTPGAEELSKVSARQCNSMSCEDESNSCPAHHNRCKLFPSPRTALEWR